jgi:hypothetical protein
MLTLRCTRKLLKRGLVETGGEDVQPTTLLGDWYANLIVARPQHLVLCVSERSLLPVILPAKDAKSLPSRMPGAVCEILAQLGINSAAVDLERREMQSVRVGRTASRRVLGSLNDFMFQLEHGLKFSPERSLVEQSLWLAETPCKPIEYVSPDKATMALFASAAVLSRVGQRAL